VDDQVIEKVKECAVSYLGMQMGDSVSVSEIYNDSSTQRFDVRIQSKETPVTGKCFVVVKDGQVSILTRPEEE
jgi:hypothetical protein